MRRMLPNQTIRFVVCFIMRCYFDRYLIGTYLRRWNTSLEGMIELHCSATLWLLAIRRYFSCPVQIALQSIDDFLPLTAIEFRQLCSWIVRFGYPSTAIRWS